MYRYKLLALKPIEWLKREIERIKAMCHEDILDS